MTHPTPTPTKIVNPEFANIFLRNVVPYGAFKAFVRFAEPHKTPGYMKVMELHSPGLFEVSIPCGEIDSATDDDNILSIELREHTT